MSQHQDEFPEKYTMENAKIKADVKVANFQPIFLIIFLIGIIYSFLIRFKLIDFKNMDTIWMIIALILFLYSLMWLIWRFSPWDAYIDDYSILREIKAGGYSAGSYMQTINTTANYFWQDAKYCKIKNNKIRVYFNKFNIINMLFFVDIYCKNNKEKQKIIGYLYKNKVIQKY